MSPDLVKQIKTMLLLAGETMEICIGRGITRSGEEDIIEVALTEEVVQIAIDKDNANEHSAYQSYTIDWFEIDFPTAP